MVRIPQARLREARDALKAVQLKILIMTVTTLLLLPLT